MKVVLLGINASWTHSCLALYYLRNAIADLDYEAEIIELTLKQNLSETLETIYKSKPDVLCLSVYIWNVEYIKQIVPEVRKLLSETTIVAGGPEISFNPNTYDKIKPDYLIKGYGEDAFKTLAQEQFNKSEKVMQGTPIPLKDIPFPYQESDLQQLKHKMIYYEASRGCACKCIYCLSSRDELMDWLPEERVKTDIDKLLVFNPKVIKFVDRSFNQKKEWARAIWKYVIGLDTTVPFHFEVHPDWLEAEDIAILSKAPKGRMQLEIGIQSIHKQTLKLISRPSDWNKVKANLQALKAETNIPLHTDLIVGLPNENQQQIIDSINEVLLAYPDELQLGFLKILQGTQMAENAKELKYIYADIAPYTVLQTPDLSFEDVLHFEKLSLILNQYWNKGDFLTVWRKALAWREPYQCMEELLQYNLKSDNQLHSIDRLKRFELMADWITQEWSGEEHAYLVDALRWDWCRKAGEAWFPDVIKSEVSLNFRKEHYTEIVDWLKSEYWQNEDWNMKRFIVFSATSNAFALDYLEGYTKAVFVSCKNEENAIVIYKKQC